MNDNKNLYKYKISLVLLKDLLNNNEITRDEFNKCKNRLKTRYNIKEDVAFIG